MATFAGFERDVRSLASGACPAYQPQAWGDPTEIAAQIAAQNAHLGEHPDPAQCANEIAGRLFQIENRMRGIAWNYSYRPAVAALLTEIRAAMARLCAEHGITEPSAWTFDEVIAGGPGYATRWPGYHG